MHQRGPEQVRGEHGHLLGLLAGAGQVAVLAVEQVVVGTVPVPRDPGPVVDLAAQAGAGEDLSREEILDLQTALTAWLRFNALPVS
nr:hypothetical protein [Streptomyces boncukensis]